ncbi:MAG: GYDIA family GHMP kinase [Bacteroidota bacterium]
MSLYSAHGKLLLTGEYLVLDGAKALAIPTRFGQQMQVAWHRSGPKLRWAAEDHQGKTWLSTALYSLDDSTDKLMDAPEEKRLLQIFRAARKQKPNVWDTHLSGRSIHTTLDFDRGWGLGTSSTLISLLSQYLEIDPYQLLEDTFGGSGYDLACATTNRPLTYLLKEGLPQVGYINWQPSWLEDTYFVYLGQKQNSRAGIRRYREKGASTVEIELASHLTDRLIEAPSLSEAQIIVKEHEALISRIIELPTVQSQHFADFQGMTKSLGAWGGDFIWVLPNNSEAPVYFSNRGYHTIFRYHQMALKS